MKHQWLQASSRLWCMCLLFAALGIVSASEFPPQTEDGLYCSPYNCYDVLEVERDAPLREIKKNYRKLSLQYHPDRNKDPAAVDKFRRISLANDVLSNPDLRADFDYYLDHPEEVFMNQYRFYSRKYAPETDARLVVLGFLLFASGFQYFVQANRHKDAVAYLKQNSKQLRKLAREQAMQQVKHLAGKRKQNRGQFKAKLEALEKQALEELSKDIDVQGGYRKASVKDLLIVRVVLLPYTFVMYLAWLANWYFKFTYKGEEYGREEHIYLTAKAIGRPVDFVAQLDAPVLDQLLEQKLWEKK